MEGFTDEDLKSISSAPVDYVALNKLAIDYSDGVIQASPEESGKPFLPYPGETEYIDKYAEFYNSL